MTTIFGEVYGAFEAAYQQPPYEDDGRRGHSNPRRFIDWTYFAIWHDKLEAAYPTLAADEIATAETVIYRLLGEGNRASRFHKLVFSAYSCGAFLVQPRSWPRASNPVMWLIDKLQDCAAGAGYGPGRAAIQSSIDALVSQHAGSIETEIAAEFAAGDFRHLAVVVKRGWLTRPVLVGSLPADLTTIDRLVDLRRGGSESHHAQIRQALTLFVSRFGDGVPKAVAEEVVNGNARHLPFIIEQSLQLRSAFCNSLSPTLATIDTLREFQRNSPDPHCTWIEQCVLRLVELHADDVVAEVVAEIAQARTGRLQLLAELGVFHPSVLDALLDHIKRSWLWDLERIERPPVSLADCELVCRYVANPAFAGRGHDIGEMLLRVMHSGGLSLDPEDRRRLLRAAGMVSGGVLLPEIVFEIERERVDFEQATKIERRIYDARQRDWATVRGEVVVRFPGSLVDATTRVVQLLNQLAGKDKWGARTLTDERRRHLLRQDLANVFRGSPGLLAQCSNLLLSLYGEVEDDVIAVFLEVADPDAVVALRLAATDPRQPEPQLRARVIIAHLEGDPSLVLPRDGRFSSISHVTAYYDQLIGSHGRAHGGYTWIEDETVERVLHRAFALADERFSEFFETQYQKHEPTLTERLLVNLEVELGRISSVLEEWSQRLRDGPVRVQFAYRDTQPEEAFWNADVAFVLHCAVGTRFTRDATILGQCKKMNFNRTTERLVGSWTVDTVQCHDLIERSPFSYYLLFGPRNGLATRTLVAPATTLRDATQTPPGGRAALTRSIPLAQLRSLSRSFADFMLYDFIGGWVGDERPELVAWARGERSAAPGARVPPRFIVSLSVTQGQTTNQ